MLCVDYEKISGNVLFIVLNSFIEEGRIQLLKINLKGMQMAEDVVVEEIARKMAGYSGADITNVCR